MKTRRKHRERKSARSKRKEYARLLESEVHGYAADAGLKLLVTDTETIHWMFNEADTGERVLDFWPATGTWIGGGKRGVVDDGIEALEVAKTLYG